MVGADGDPCFRANGRSRKGRPARGRSRPRPSARAGARTCGCSWRSRSRTRRSRRPSLRSCPGHRVGPGSTCLVATPDLAVAGNGLLEVGAGAWPRHGARSVQPVRISAPRGAEVASAPPPLALIEPLGLGHPERASHRGRVRITEEGAPTAPAHGHRLDRCAGALPRRHRRAYRRLLSLMRCVWTRRAVHDAKTIVLRCPSTCPREARSLPFRSGHDHERARRVVGDALADGAEEEARGPAATARAHDEELGAASLLDEHRGRVTLDRDRLDSDGVAGCQAAESGPARRPRRGAPLPESHRWSA